MADPLGVSFSPTGHDGPNAPRPSPVQQAIQTLSLRIPSHAGTSAFTPQSLLDAPGGAGLGGNADAILELLKKVLFGPPQGRMGPGQMPGGMPEPPAGGGGIPDPRVVPGSGVPTLPRDGDPGGPGIIGVPSPLPRDPDQTGGGTIETPTPLPRDPGLQAPSFGPSETSYPMPTMRRGSGNRV